MPIPVWEGLQGYRQLMIHEDNQTQFDNVTDLDSLSKLIPGQGDSWTEVLIYEDNGIKVMTAVDLTSLYNMLGIVNLVVL